MPSVLGLGDNTIDIYVDRGMQYPGGNSLNFAVYAKKLGAQSHYMGCIGDDAYGDQIEGALAAEGVSCPRLRRTAYQTSWSRVRHKNGDRWFDGSHLYSAGEYQLTLDDEAYMGQFDLVHIGVNSMLDDKIGDIARASRRLSYDFSDKYTDTSLGRIAPHTEVAVLSSAEGGSCEAQDLARQACDQGAPVVLVTRGSLGVICLSGGKFYEQSIIEAGVVDTLGAGDAFTAAFIVEHLKGMETQAAMLSAAMFASEVCQIEAAFGRGHEITSIPASNRPQERNTN